MLEVAYNRLKSAIDEIRAEHPEVKGLVLNLEGTRSAGLRYAIHECDYKGQPVGKILKEFVVAAEEVPVSSSAD